MRILTVTPASEGIGGLQDVMRDTVRGLADRGHSVEVLTAAHPDLGATTLLDNQGIAWHYLPSPSNRGTKPGRSVQWLRETVERARMLHTEQAFDVILSESNSGAALRRDAFFRDLPTVVRFHGNYLGEIASTISRLRSASDVRSAKSELGRMRWATLAHFRPPSGLVAFRGATVVVPSAQQVRLTKASYLLGRSRTYVVPNGIDAHQFRPARDEARALDPRPAGKVILAASRLEFDKGFDVAIDAMAQLRDTDATLVILGEGRAEASLRAQVARHGLGERVWFVGGATPGEMPGWLNTADVFLFATRRDEAAPLMPLQAISCGVPLIGSQSGAVPEIIDRPGVNGLIVPKGDVPATAAAVRSVLVDDALARRLGEEGRKTVMERFTTDRMVDGIEAVIAASARRNEP